MPKGPAPVFFPGGTKVLMPQVSEAKHVLISLINIQHPLRLGLSVHSLLALLLLL